MAPEQTQVYGFWKTTFWALIAVVASIAGTFVVLVALALWLGRDPNDALSESILGIAASGMLLAVLLSAVRRIGQSPQDYLAFFKPTPTAIAIAIAGAGFIGIFEDWSASILGVGPSDFASNLEDYRAAQAGNVLLLFWFNTALFAPITEEVLFRGFLFRGWSVSRLGPVGTILLTSALFGVLHFQYTWHGMALTGLTGFFVGWLRWRCGSIYPPAVCHIATNTMALITAALSV